jgi:hypothetical protein
MVSNFMVFPERGGRCRAGHTKTPRRPFHKLSGTKVIETPFRQLSDFGSARKENLQPFRLLCYDGRMATDHSSIFTALLSVSLAFALGGCHSGDEEKAGPPPKQDPLEVAPPAPRPEDPGLVTLTLTGGRFGDKGRKIILPIEGRTGVSKVTRTPRGLRVVICPPSYEKAHDIPRWGLWLFLEGRVREDRPMHAVTGTQIVVDGIPLAPAADPAGKTTPSSPALQATLFVEIIDPPQKTLEGIFDGVFLPPEGGDKITIHGSVKLPWPPAAPKTP